MEKSVLISEEVNYSWNFLNYPIHTISSKPEITSKDCAILLIHGFGASTDHWPVSYTHLTLPTIYSV